MEDRPPAEADLVRRARDGDGLAFGELVQIHQETAFRAAYLIVADADEAADAAQEGFVKAYEALSRFRDGSPFRPWLLRIVANSARNRRRSSRRREALRLRAQAASAPAASAPSAENVVVADAGRRQLVAAIDALSPDDRLVIAGRYFLDLSEAEIAAIAGIRRGTVKSRLARARARLAAALGGDRGEWADG